MQWEKEDCLEGFLLLASLQANEGSKEEGKKWQPENFVCVCVCVPCQKLSLAAFTMDQKKTNFFYSTSPYNIIMKKMKKKKNPDIWSKPS